VPGLGGSGSGARNRRGSLFVLPFRRAARSRWRTISRDGLAGVLGHAGAGLGLGGVVLGRAGVGLGGGVLDALEQRGHGDLGGVERVVEEPRAPHVAGVAAFVPGPDEAPAGPCLDGQVDAGAELLVAVLRPVAAHVLAVGDALAQAAQRGALVGVQQVDERHGSFSGEKRGGPGEGAGRPPGVCRFGSVTGGVGAGAQNGRSGALPCPLGRVPLGSCPAGVIVVRRRSPSRVRGCLRADSGRRAGSGRSVQAWLFWWRLLEPAGADRWRFPLGAVVRAGFSVRVVFDWVPRGSGPLHSVRIGGAPPTRDALAVTRFGVPEPAALRSPSLVFTPGSGPRGGGQLLRQSAAGRTNRPLFIRPLRRAWRRRRPRR